MHFVVVCFKFGVNEFIKLSIVTYFLDHLFPTENTFFSLVLLPPMTESVLGCVFTLVSYFSQK